MLLHMAGPETQEVFETLTPVDNTYDKALEVLNTHFAVKKKALKLRRSLKHLLQLTIRTIRPLKS